MAKCRICGAKAAGIGFYTCDSCFQANEDRRISAAAGNAATDVAITDEANREAENSPKDDAEKDGRPMATETRGNPPPSRVAAALAIISGLLMAVSVIGRLMTGYIPRTANGLYLWQHGFPFSLASALDMGTMSPVMALAMLLGLIAMLLGFIAVLRKGRKALAVTGILLGGCAGTLPVLLFALAAILPRVR